MFIGHLRTLEHVMWSVAPTRLDHCLSPMHSESTWFTSVRSLAETDSPGRAQTGTRLAASPGVSDMVAFHENPAKLWLYDQQLPTSDSRQATHYDTSAPMVPYQGATTFRPAQLPPASRWKPRSKTGHSLWRTNLNDRLATSDLLDTADSPPPSLDDMSVTYPYMSATELYAVWLDALSEYRDENTELYHLVYATIDLSGPREEIDINHIARRFHHGVHRDGQGLLNWLDSFADCSATGDQDRLQTELAEAKLTSSSGTVFIATLEKHCVDTLLLWTKITGNDISRPASYNARLLSSIPSNSTGLLGSLRAWLADKITDGAPFLAEPEMLIEKLLTHARTLGMPQGGSEARGSGGLFAVLRNDCKHCTARVCAAGSKKDDCICFNPRKPVPAEASDGERNFVFTARKYIAACEPKPDSIKNVSLADMKAKTKADSSDASSSPAPAPVAAAAGAAATPIISNQAEFNAWFQKSMNTSAGTRKVVNVVAPIAEEGGLTPVIAKPNPMHDPCVNMIAPPFNCADAFTKPSVHMVTPRPRGSPLRDSRSACSGLRSPLSAGYGPGAPVFAPPQRAAPSRRTARPPPASLHFLGWMAVPRAAYGAIVAKISNSNSDERKSALLALALVWIAARRFSSPVTSLLAARWARVRAVLLRIALRIVRALGVGAVRVTMAASAAEPQLAGALA